MYLLNDKHEDYEYCLYIQVGTACPYLTPLKYVNSLEDIYKVIEEIEKKHRRMHVRFFIDNDFYSNEYNISSGGWYYKFLRRPVADWEEFDKENILWVA